MAAMNQGAAQCVELAAGTKRRRVDTRRRLLEAAYSVFAAKSFGRTRIEDICQASGYTKGAFYSNFSTLEELFFALYRQHSQLAAEHTLRVLASTTGDVNTAIIEWANGLSIDRDWLLINTDFVLHAARNPTVAANLAHERTQLREEIAGQLSAHLVGRAHALPPTLPTPRDWARAIVSIFDGVMSQLLLDMDEAAVRKHFIAIVTALTPPPDAPEPRHAG